MKRKLYLIIGVTIVFLAILFISNKSYAGEQELKSLDFNVNLNSDGTATISETWEVYIKNTNTLFKTFNIDSSRYSEIKDVTVVETTSGSKKSFKQIYQEKYHVDKDCYYALKNSKGQFEIAWGVSEDHSKATRVFRINYKVVDAVKNYADCSEFYWQFVGNEFEIPADHVNGTIWLPSNVTNIDDLRVWAHGPLNGNIERVSRNTVKFDVSSLKKETMVEVRIVTPTYVFENNQNRYNKEKLPTILAEEEKWANEANVKRILSGVFMVLACIVGVIAAGVFIGLFIKYLIEGKKLKATYKREKSKLQYFREIPNEEYATPARAAYMCFYRNSGNPINVYLPKVFSATILDLALKGIISFEPIDDKDFMIIINKGIEFDITNDERCVYQVLICAAKGNDRVSAKELKQYSKKEYEKVYKILKNISTYVETYSENKGYIDQERKKVHEKWDGKAMIYIVLFIFSLFFMAVIPPLLIGLPFLLACAIVCSVNAGYVDKLSDIGNEEREKWNGLKKYMNDFSLLKEKEVPDLILWEKYLVYATAFGISDKVVQQLKVVYKEFNDSDYLAHHNFTYMCYMSNSQFGNNFISNLNTTMTSVCTAATSSYSSAHGGGGGFSGGGGGRRWRWPEAADAKKSRRNR